MTQSVLAAAGLSATLALATACGGMSGSTAETTAVTTASTTAAESPSGGVPDMSAYRDCLASNGVTLPEFDGQGGPPSAGPGQGGFPGGDLPDVDQEAFDAAQAACASLAPQGGPAAGGGRPDETALAAFRSCLTDHDVTVPEGEDWLAELDRSDASVSAAMETCAPLLPSLASPAPAAS